MRALLLFLISLSCVSWGSARADSSTGYSNSTIQYQTILFLTYNFQKGKDESVSVRLTDKKEVAGKLKDYHNTINGSYYVLRQVSAGGVILARTTFSDPLNKIIEYSDKSGEMHRKRLEKEEAQVYVRIQRHSEAIKLVVSKAESPGQVLLTTKLQ